MIENIMLQLNPGLVRTLLFIGIVIVASLTIYWIFKPKKNPLVELEKDYPLYFHSRHNLKREKQSEYTVRTDKTTGALPKGFELKPKDK